MLIYCSHTRTLTSVYKDFHNLRECQKAGACRVASKSNVALEKRVGPLEKEIQKKAF